MDKMGNNVWIGITNMIYSIHSSDDANEMCKIFLKQLRWLIPFDRALFSLASKDKEGMIQRPVYVNFEESYIDMYMNNYNKYDYVTGLKFGNSSMVYRESDIMDESVWLNSYFCNEFCKPNKIKFIANTILSYNNRFCGNFSLYRNSDTINARDYSTRDIFILNLLKDHLSMSIVRLDGEIAAKKMIEKNRETNTKNNIINDGKYTVKECTDEFHLTAKEQEILRLLVSGVSTEQICEQLFITLNTLKKHNLSIYKKMGINNRIQLFKIIRQN